ncbi:MAG TPA: tripartite tricarboxylate transporter substrate binding protein [Xanthobacteraceae bacterium]|jgi:tripartite-type tricarboxylate transporter receptor subunit TctC|nr:tripartite tricarboxylate transporter substrate binding protein [Xanthobacteraceae bacterium]
MSTIWAQRARSARVAVALGGIIGAGFGWAANAQSTQSYPARPIHIVVPFAPGGITDILARALGQRLAEAWGQQVVVENRPGANSQLGADLVARAVADGTTLMVSADTTFVMNPHLYGKLAYDALTDFLPVSGLGIGPQALVVHPGVPVGDVSGLIGLARRKPGELNYGTFGIGSSGHLNIELLQSMTGTKFTAVHYKGAAPALTDVIGGHIQMMIVSIGLVTQPWQAGQLKVLGFGSTARLAQFPDVPTIAETGLAGYEAASWYGLVAPAGTPRDIVDKLSAETQRIFGEAAFREKFLAPNMIFSIAGTPDEFAARIRADYAKWGKVIKDANVKVE